MMRDELPGLIRVGPRVIQTDAEFAHLQAIRTASFTPWSVDVPGKASFTDGRVAMNAVARAFPEFFHQARTVDEQAVGYFATVPGYWGGSAQALPDLHYYSGNLHFGRRQMLALGLAHRSAQALPWTRGAFDRLAAGMRRERLRGANAIVLVGMAIDPAFQGMQLPAMFFDAAKRSARSLGLRHIIAPFRPSGYGQYKALRNGTHSAELFKEYCLLRTLEGWPMDAWLRVVARHGAEFLRAELRSYRIERPLARFEQLRQSFKPGSWYSPEPDVWECGETPTWYVDRARGTVTSVEPSLWGRLRWDPTAA
jgi:GNAT superfamily N-acetyltransferase